MASPDPTPPPDATDSRLRVAIDVAPLHGHRTGVGVATEHVLAALRRRDDVTALPYLVSFRARPEPGQRRLPLPAGAAMRLWSRSALPRVDRWLRDADVVHGTNYVAPSSRRPTVVSVYDCWFLAHPEAATPAVARAGAVLRRLVARGARIHVSSDATARVAAELLDTDRISVVHLGPPAPIRPPTTDTFHIAEHIADAPRISDTSHIADASHIAEHTSHIADASHIAEHIADAPHISDAPRIFDHVLPEPLRDRPFLVAIGTLERRKDVPALVDAFGRLAPDHPDLGLAIAGAVGDDHERVIDHVRRLPPGVRDRVHVLGTVASEVRDELLRRATALVYPSVDEGFGFPILEAQQAGTAVVARRVGSIPEVGGAGVALAPDNSVEALAATIGTVLDDDHRRAELIESGRVNLGRFSWDTTAARLVEIYRTAIAEQA